MRFQERDGELLKAIQSNDGVLSRRHIKALFWPDKHWRAMEQRLAKLKRAGYINWPSREQYKTQPVPEAICWLDWKGILYIADSLGVDAVRPKGDNEYQLRKLETRLRKKNVRWVREPRWSMLEHDLAVIDFKLALESFVNEHRSLVLENWVLESQFRSFADSVVVGHFEKDGIEIPIKEKVFPDGYFQIVDERLQSMGKACRIRCLLEFDMGTHHPLRFGKDKVTPGVAYIKSSVFKSRFGSNNGYWLVIAKGGPARIYHLILQVEKNAGFDADRFFFASLDEIRDKDPLTSSIWKQVGISNCRPLLVA